MRLKRVKIFGFKTFADRTEFDLDGGLVAVVGSNGCGKSNLVDAILWGLGEASPRHLRAASSTEVIFNGSAGRKPIGYAEVSLLFENEDGGLPLEAPEVTVTRKVTRGGDSEYRINRQICRQRDVYELFADSGLGRAGYAIVGQKEIDAALSASAEDRRGWIDEAAGVQRYRARKSEAQKRLNAARGHLERTRDILLELENQREPLRREAEVATRYRTVHETLQTVETDLLLLEVATAIKNLERLAGQLSGNAKLVLAEQTSVEAASTELEEVGRAISTCEQVLDDLRSTLQKCLTSIERAEGDIRLAEQRLMSLDTQEVALQGNQQDETMMREIASEIETLEAELAAEKVAQNEWEARWAALTDQTSGLASALDQAERAWKAAQESEAARGRILAEEAHRKERLKLIDRERDGISASASALESDVAAATEAESAALAEQKAAQDALADFENRLLAGHQLTENSASEHRRLKMEIATLEGRVKGIESTILTHEGLHQGAKAILEAVSRGELVGSFQPVGASIIAPTELALAVETALGTSASDLIVDRDEEAKKGIEWLRDRRAGRATFQPIPLMRPVTVTPQLRRIAQMPGVLGRASELVDFEPHVRPVIESLLGRILIVETLEQALPIAREEKREFSRIVTLDGEVVHSSGAVTGGIAGRQGYGLVQRQADLEAGLAELSELTSNLHAVEKASNLQLAKDAAYSQQIQDLRRAEAEVRIRCTEAHQFAQTLRDEKNAMEKSRLRLERERADMARAHGPLPKALELAPLAQVRDEAWRKLALVNADADAIAVGRKDVQARLSKTGARLEAARRRLKLASEAGETRLASRAAIGPARAKANADRVAAIESRARLQAEHQDIELALSAKQRIRTALLEHSLQLTDHRRGIEDAIRALQAGAHQQELDRARWEARRATSLERLLDEYGLDEEDALAREDQLQIPPDAAVIVSRLRKELKAMGDVNLGAAEAFERLSVRFTELEARQQDVIDGIAEVDRAIAELDGKTMGRFQTTLIAVQEAFKGMVRRLFDGGEGEIVLSEPNTILDSGIEILVTLPGKKRQQLGLLSGGERSLCAMAFLFALLEVKSSPLVVLDEVDAPLDGVNVERFAELLKDFSEKIQFIVITHNPATIASAPIWLGITMAEPGCSTLVPHRAAAKIAL